MEDDHTNFCESLDDPGSIALFMADGEEGTFWWQAALDEDDVFGVEEINDILSRIVVVFNGAETSLLPALAWFWELVAEDAARDAFRAASARVSVRQGRRMNAVGVDDVTRKRALGEG